MYKVGDKLVVAESRKANREQLYTVVEVLENDEFNVKHPNGTVFKMALKTINMMFAKTTQDMEKSFFTDVLKPKFDLFDVVWYWNMEHNKYMRGQIVSIIYLGSSYAYRIFRPQDNRTFTIESQSELLTFKEVLEKSRD